MLRDICSSDVIGGVDLNFDVVFGVGFHFWVEIDEFFIIDQGTVSNKFELQFIIQIDFPTNS